MTRSAMLILLCPCVSLPFTSIRLVEDFHFRAAVQCSAHLFSIGPPGLNFEFRDRNCPIRGEIHRLCR